MPDRSLGLEGPSIRLSVWTVLGSVAAAVLTAGVLGSASGILQIPTLQTDVTGLKGSRDTMIAAIQDLTVKERTEELEAQGLQRQLNDVTVRFNAIIVRLDKKDSDDRSLDIQTQRDLQATEGRSKDRNTQVNGEINALRTEMVALQDRAKAQTEALTIVRQSLYDLLTRGYSLPNQRPQSGLVPQSQPQASPIPGSDKPPQEIHDVTHAG